MSEIRICKVCGKTLKYRQKFTCSHVCLGKYKTQTENITFNCGFCGKLKIIPRYRYVKDGQRTCSKECASKLRYKSHVSLKRSYTCLNCDRSLSRFPSTRRGLTSFCSRVCYWDWTKKIHRYAGENNPAWKGGRSYEYNRYGSKSLFRGNEELRTFVFSRDQNKCLVCEDTKYIHIHHIDGDGKNDDTKNLVTLCAHCHRLIEMGKLVSPDPSDKKPWSVPQT